MFGRHREQKRTQKSKWIFIGDKELPPRTTLHPRLYAKHLKICGFQYTKADLIIWIDGAYQIISDEFTHWMVKCLNNNDICLMPHPYRTTIKEEVDYINLRIAHGDGYLINRYREEPMSAQVSGYLKDPEFKDFWLAEAGCFIYRNNKKMHNVMNASLSECVRWSVQDQLSLPYVLQKAGVVPSWLDKNRHECTNYLTYIPHA